MCMVVSLVIDAAKTRLTDVRDPPAKPAARLFVADRLKEASPEAKRSGRSVKL
jgi:hypothetical protein